MIDGDSQLMDDSRDEDSRAKLKFKGDSQIMYSPPKANLISPIGVDDLCSKNPLC
jgi:hypothetical protein